MNQEEDFFTNAECGYDNIEFTEYYNPFEYTYNRIRMKDHPLGI